MGRQHELSKVASAIKMLQLQELDRLYSQRTRPSVTRVKEMPSFTMKTKLGSSRTFISGGRWLHGPHRAMLYGRFVPASAAP
uniref:Uncharacterized protein n=1 Tax=Timema shepardi TaxID=629360 RepID=A0A7R9G3L2_TIMSH|nr:unnamed protein product [Timema shepardi]